MGCITSIRLTRPPSDLLEAELFNHAITHRTSFLCARWLEEEHPLQVLQTPAGWYLGVWPEGDEPYSRDSQYFPTKEAAEQALEQRTWTQRLDP